MASTTLRSKTEGELSLIPMPQEVLRGKGRFVFSEEVSIAAADKNGPEDRFSAARLQEELYESLQLRPRIASTGGKRTIRLGRIGRDKAVDAAIAKAGITPPAKLGEEGYILRVAPEEILIAANTAAGVFYGVQTLRQLVRSNRKGNSIPCLTITDWPALALRGWMDDISRGPIPTMEFLKNVVRKLAEYKLNYFTLYTEHVFKLKAHPDVAPADGITAEEIAELTAFAKQYHVELVGNFQSFGHMEKILRIPFYAEMRESGHILSPAAEETYRFLESAYSEVAPAYESDLFNINCDETFGLGEGKSKKMVEEMGLDGLYAYHINRLDQLLKRHGKRIMMWGDIAVHNPGIIARLPKDLIILSWGYHAAESFDDAILPFKESGFEFMVAPGVSCWGEIWPNMTNAAINISNYIRDGAKLGAMGVMNTTWDDDGENLFNHNWHGLLWGAECSWKPAAPLAGEEAARDRDERLEAFNRAFDRLFYGQPGVSGVLLRFDALRQLPVREAVRNGSMWRDILEFHSENTSAEAARNNQTLLEGAESLQWELAGLRTSVPKNGGTLDYAIFAAKRVAYVARKNLARIALHKAFLSPTPKLAADVRNEIADLLRALHAIKNEYVILWNRETRPWWLDRNLAKYDREGERLLELENQVFIEPENTVTAGKRKVRLRTIFEDKTIRCTCDGSEIGARSPAYEVPLEIEKSSLIRAAVFEQGRPREVVEQFVMVHRGIGKLHRLNTPYSGKEPAYTGGGDMALLDGLRGSLDFKDGRWQGYEENDLDAVIDLGSVQPVRRICVAFLQQSFSWILLPSKVEFWTSDDGKRFVLARELPNPVDPKTPGTVIHDFEAVFDDLRTRFIRVVGRTMGKLPEWHHAADGKVFLFADEIVVE